MKSYYIIPYALVGMASVMISYTLTETLDKMMCSPSCELKAEELVCEGNKTADHLREILECVIEIPTITVLVMRVSALKCTCQWYHFANSVVNKKVHLITTPTVKTCLDKGTAICHDSPTPAPEDVHNFDYQVITSPPESVQTQDVDLGPSHWDSILGDTKDWVAIKKIHNAPMKEKTYDDLKTDDLIYIIIILVSVTTPVVCGLVFLVLYKMKQKDKKRGPDDEKPKKKKPDIFSFFKTKKSGKKDSNNKQAKVPLLDQGSNVERTKKETVKMNKKLLSQAKKKGKDKDYIEKVNKLFGEDWKQFPTYGPGTFPNTDGTGQTNNNNVKKKLLWSETETESDSSDEVYNIWTSPAPSVKDVNRSWNNQQLASSQPSESDVSLLRSESSALPCTSVSERTLPEFVAFEKVKLEHPRQQSEAREERLSQTSDTDLTDIGLPGFSRPRPIKHSPLLQTRCLSHGLDLNNQSVKAFPQENVSRTLVTPSYFSSASSGEESSSAKEIFLRENKSGSLVTFTLADSLTNGNQAANSVKEQYHRRTEYALSRKHYDIPDLNKRQLAQNCLRNGRLVQPCNIQNNLCVSHDNCLEYNLNAETSDTVSSSWNSQDSANELCISEKAFSPKRNPAKLDSVPKCISSCAKQGHIDKHFKKTTLPDSNQPVYTMALDKPYRAGEKKIFPGRQKLLQIPETNHGATYFPGDTPRHKILSDQLDSNSCARASNCLTSDTRRLYDTGVETESHSSKEIGTYWNRLEETNPVLQTSDVPFSDDGSLGSVQLSEFGIEKDNLCTIGQPKPTNAHGNPITILPKCANILYDNSQCSNISPIDDGEHICDQNFIAVDKDSPVSGNSMERFQTSNESTCSANYRYPNALPSPIYLEKSPAVSQYLSGKQVGGRFFPDLSVENSKEVAEDGHSFLDSSSEIVAELIGRTSAPECIIKSRKTVSNHYENITIQEEIKDTSTASCGYPSNLTFASETNPVDSSENICRRLQFQDASKEMSRVSRLVLVNHTKHGKFAFENGEETTHEHLNSPLSDFHSQTDEDSKNCDTVTSLKPIINEIEDLRSLAENSYKANVVKNMESIGLPSFQAIENDYNKTRYAGDTEDYQAGNEQLSCLHVDDNGSGKGANTGLTPGDERTQNSDCSGILRADSLSTDFTSSVNRYSCGSPSNQLTLNPGIISTEHSLTNVTYLSSISFSNIQDSLSLDNSITSDDSLTIVSRFASVNSTGTMTSEMNNTDEIYLNSTEEHFSSMSLEMDSNVSSICSAKGDNSFEDSCLLHYNMSD